nr:hypothetical protein [Tanacetum cinerariifolium]
LYDNSSPRPPEEEFVSENSNAEIESFSPSHILIEDSDSHMEEIDLPFNSDGPMPPSIKDDDDESERDVLIREELPSNYSLSLPVNESFCFDIPSFSCPPAKPPDGDAGILNIKMMGDVSDQKISIPTSMGFDMSLHNEDFPGEIFSNPLFEEEINSMRIGQHHSNLESDFIGSLLNHDSSIIPSSSKIDSLLDEFAGELTLLKSIPPGIDETDYHPENEIRLSQRLLYGNLSPRPPEEFVSENSNADTESFSPSPIIIEDSDYPVEEIDVTFTSDDPMPPSIEEDDNDSRDILIREELLDNYSLSIPENESFHFDIPLSSRPHAKPPDGDGERDVNVNETFHEQTDDEFFERELKQIEADDQAIQTILLGLPEDIL